MENPTYNARDLARFPQGSKFEELPKHFNILFEDGVTIPSTRKEVIYSNHFWEFHRRYDRAPLLSNHHVRSILKGKPLGANTHINFLTILSNHVRDVYSFERNEDIEDIAQLVYEVTNNVYNDLSLEAEAHVPSIDILDFIELTDYPPIKTIVDNTKPTERSIAECYEGIKKILYKDPDIAHNVIVKMVRSGIVNINQILQCISIRGFLADVDGWILPTPVMTNYTDGLHTLYENMAESLSAAKNLHSSASKISETEYFARRLQLLTMVVERIDHVDCGSNHYIDWRVNPPVRDDAKGIDYPGDLKFMNGKYYLDEQSNTLKMIKRSDKHLYGKVLKLRTAMYCKSPDPHAVCKVCFGGLSVNISKYANLGHLCAATMTEQSTSSVLSSKHLLQSSVGVVIDLNEEASKVFVVDRDRNLFLINPIYKNKQLELVINREQAQGLTDILLADSLDAINIYRLSCIKELDVRFMDKDFQSTLPLDIDQSNRSPVFSMELLQYLKQYRWTVDSRNNFIFDMSHWDFNLPVFKLPEAEYSFSDHSMQLAKLIESSMKQIADRSNPDSPVTTLQELFMLVNSKLNVNLAVLEVIIYANMVPDRGSIGLARNSDAPVLGISDNLIKQRSLSAAYAYEDQTTVMTNPMSFFPLNRPDNVLDVCIDPKRVIECRKGSYSRV